MKRLYKRVYKPLKLNYNKIMKFYTQDIVKKTRDLREGGSSTEEIAKKLNISKHNVLRWCFDIPSENAYHLRFLKIKEELKKKGEKSLNGFTINKNDAKIFAAILYWCEGYKYPSCSYVGFTNSDFNLVKTFLELFRIGFNPKEEKFRAHLQLHTTHDKKEITSFWSDLLKISEKCFYKPTITKPTNRMKRRDYKGTCTVKYYDFNIYNEIVGIYEAFIRKIKD